MKTLIIKVQIGVGFPLLLAACSSTTPPPLVIMPNFNQGGGQNENLNHKDVDGTSLNNYQNKDKTVQQFAHLPVETDISKINDKMDLYAMTWNQQSALYRQYANDLLTTQFFSAVFGGVSGTTKSPQGAAIGVGVSGISGLINSHYNFSVQSTNYLQGAQAMYCLQQAVFTVQLPVWKTFYRPDGQFVLSKQDLLDAVSDDGADLSADDQQNAESGYATLTGLIPAIEQNINSIIQKLENAQQNVVAIAPSASDIQAAITAHATSTATAAAATAPLQKGAKAAAPKQLEANRSALQTNLMGKYSVLAQANKAQENSQALLRQTTVNLASTQNSNMQLKQKLEVITPGASDNKPSTPLIPLIEPANDQSDMTSADAANAQTIALNKVHADSENVAAALKNVITTQGNIDNLSPLDTDRIGDLLLIPAAMAKCVAIVGATPAVPKTPPTANTTPSAAPATVPTTGALVAPTSVKLSSASSKITVTFKPSKSSGVKGYTATATNVSKATDNHTASGSATSTSIVIPGCAAGQNYNVELQVKGSASNTATATVPNPVKCNSTAVPANTSAVPGTPTSVLAVSSGGGQIDVTFTGPTDFGDGQLSNFTAVAVDTAKGGKPLTANSNGPQQSVSLTGCKVGDKYTVTVVTNNTNNKSGLPSKPSNPVTCS